MIEILDSIKELNPTYINSPEARMNKKIKEKIKRLEFQLEIAKKYNFNIPEAELKINQRIKKLRGQLNV